MRTLIRVFITLPVAVIVIMLAVANRKNVALSFNPLDPENPATMIDVPIFWLVFACVALGVILGGMVVYFKQHKFRVAARDNRYEAAKWRAEADRQREELAALTDDNKAPALPLPRRAA